MYKFQYKFILYVVLAILTIMTVASTEKAVPMTVEQNAGSEVKISSKIKVGPPEKESLKMLSKAMTKIILGYLEIHTGFKYILQTKAFYRTLRTTLTEVAHTQYHAFLTTANKVPSSPTLLTRYVHFLQAPLDPSILFPEPTVLVLSQLPTSIPPRILCSTLRAHPEAKLTDFFHKEPSLHAYRLKNEDGEFATSTPCSTMWFRLPLVYDPQQAMLHLYPMTDSQPGFRKRLRLPAVLLFWMADDRMHTEHVCKWLGCEWRGKNSPCDFRGGLSVMSWYNPDSRWMFETFFFADDGVIQRIRVVDLNKQYLNVQQQHTFFMIDGGKSYIMVSVGGREFGYKHIVPFYYPRKNHVTTSTIPNEHDKSTAMDEKQQFSCCCNIV